jgi:hypothetical protein
MTATMPIDKPTPYDRMLLTGAAIDNHESDLYVEVTAETSKIVREIAKEGWHVTGFTDHQGKHWYDVAFAFDPFWRRRAKPQIITPQYSLNGTSAQSLAEQFDAARQAVQAAIDAIIDAAPHGRDYQHDPSQYEKARDEYEMRLQRLRGVMNDYEVLRDDALSHVK